MKTSELQRLVSQLAGSREANPRPRSLQPAVQELRRAGATPDGRRLFHDELTILAALAEEIDNETDPNSAWDLVSDIRRLASLKRQAYRDHLVRAVRDNLHGCTVGFLDMKKREAASTKCFLSQ